MSLWKVLDRLPPNQTSGYQPSAREPRTAQYTVTDAKFFRRHLAPRILRSLRHIISNTWPLRKAKFGNSKKIYNKRDTLEQNAPFSLIDLDCFAKLRPN